MRPNRQRADADARCGEDRIADRGYCRRQRGFAQTGRIEVRLKELDFNRRRGVPYTRRLILVEITLYDAALVDRNFPSHHVAHRFNEPSLNEGGGMERVYDLASDVDRRPHLVDFQFLFRSDCDFRHVGNVAGMRELERHAQACTFRKLAAPVVPIRHISDRFEHANRPFVVERRAERNFRESRNRSCRIVQQIQSVLQRILTGRLRDFVDERLQNERNAIGRWRTQGSHRDAIRRDVTF